MPQSESIINSFPVLVRKLVSQYVALKKENSELYAMVDKRDKEIEELKASLLAEQKKYDMLMAAKMMNIADTDIEQTKKRISRMLRSVNQCITLLNQQNQQEE